MASGSRGAPDAVTIAREAITRPGSQDKNSRSALPRTRTRISSSLRTPAQQNRLNGLKHDQKIQTNGSILYIKEIVLKLFASVGDRAAIFVSDLRPTSKSGPYHVAHPVIGNFFREHLNEFRPLGARANKCHIALEHAPKLWNLIEPRSTEKFADPGNTRIVITCPLGTGCGFGIRLHGSELHYLEVMSTLANSRLGVEDRAFRIEVNGEHYEGEQG